MSRRRLRTNLSLRRQSNKRGQKKTSSKEASSEDNNEETDEENKTKTVKGKDVERTKSKLVEESVKRLSREVDEKYNKQMNNVNEKDDIQNKQDIVKKEPSKVVKKYKAPQVESEKEINKTLGVEKEHDENKCDIATECTEAKIELREPSVKKTLSFKDSEAGEMNDSVEFRKSKYRIQELQSENERFNPRSSYMIKTKGNLFYKKKGPFSKWKVFYIVLDDYKLQMNFFKSHEDYEKLSRCKQSIDLRFVNELKPRKPHLLQSNYPFKMYRRAGLSTVRLAAYSEEERAKWITTLDEIVNKIKSSPERDFLPSEFQRSSTLPGRTTLDGVSTDSECGTTSSAPDQENFIKPKKISTSGFKLNSSEISSVKLKRINSEAKEPPEKKIDDDEKECDPVEKFGVSLRKVNSEKVPPRNEREQSPEYVEFKEKYTSLSLSRKSKSRSPKLPLKENSTCSHLVGNMKEDPEIPDQSKISVKGPREPNKKRSPSPNIPISKTVETVMKNKNKEGNFPIPNHSKEESKISDVSSLNSASICHATSSEIHFYESSILEVDELIKTEAQDVSQELMANNTLQVTSKPEEINEGTSATFVVNEAFVLKSSQTLPSIRLNDSNDELSAENSGNVEDLEIQNLALHDTPKRYLVQQNKDKLPPSEDLLENDKNVREVNETAISKDELIKKEDISTDERSNIEEKYDTEAGLAGTIRVKEEVEKRQKDDVVVEKNKLFDEKNLATGQFDEENVVNVAKMTVDKNVFEHEKVLCVEKSQDGEKIRVEEKKNNAVFNSEEKDSTIDKNILCEETIGQENICGENKANLSEIENLAEDNVESDLDVKTKTKLTNIDDHNQNDVDVSKEKTKSCVTNEESSDTEIKVLKNNLSQNEKITRNEECSTNYEILPIENKQKFDGIMTQDQMDLILQGKSETPTDDTSKTNKTIHFMQTPSVYRESHLSSGTYRGKDEVRLSGHSYMSQISTESDEPLPRLNFLGKGDRSSSGSTCARDSGSSEEQKIDKSSDSDEPNDHLSLRDKSIKLQPDSLSSIGVRSSLVNPEFTVVEEGADEVIEDDSMKSVSTEELLDGIYTNPSKPVDEKLSFNEQVCDIEQDIQPQTIMNELDILSDETVEQCPAGAITNVKDDSTIENTDRGSELVKPVYTVKKDDEAISSQTHEANDELKVDTQQLNSSPTEPNLILNKYSNEESKQGLTILCEIKTREGALDNKFIECEETEDYFPTYEGGKTKVDFRLQEDKLKLSEASMRTSGITGLKQFLKENEENSTSPEIKSGISRLGSSPAFEKLRKEVP